MLIKILLKWVLWVFIVIGIVFTSIFCLEPLYFQQIRDAISYRFYYQIDMGTTSLYQWSFWDEKWTYEVTFTGEKQVIPYVRGMNTILFDISNLGKKNSIMLTPSSWTGDIFVLWYFPEFKSWVSPLDIQTLSVYNIYDVSKSWKTCFVLSKSKDPRAGNCMPITLFHWSYLTPYLKKLILLFRASEPWIFTLENSIVQNR